MRCRPLPVRTPPAAGEAPLSRPPPATPARPAPAPRRARDRCGTRACPPRPAARRARCASSARPVVADAGAPHRAAARAGSSGSLPLANSSISLRDAHAAPVVAAHGAEVGVDVEVFVVVARGPVSGSKVSSKCFSQLSAARALVSSSSRSRAPGMPQRDVGGVGGDLVGDAALLRRRPSWAGRGAPSA